MYNPVSTYRIQFQRAFNFKDFQNIIFYLKKLGIRTLYASPIFESTPGSTHGYDGLNPFKINPEIGEEPEFINISQQLKENGIGWLQDVVPNHMAFDVRNPWIRDVLEKGRQSRYAGFFDIDWNSRIYEGRLMVPFLGKSFGDAINDGEVKIGYTDGRMVLEYYETHYPVNLQSYLTVLSVCDENCSREIIRIEEKLQGIQKIEKAELVDLEWKKVFDEVAECIKKINIQGCISKFNKDKDLLWQIANRQYYRLCHWQETDGYINYRRFFTVNGLICLNMQELHLFDQYHSYIDALVKQNIFDGLRIDHIDGLYDPSSYLMQLRKLVGDQIYIIVEKILALKEELQASWPIQGNTGYDFLSIVNNLFTNKNVQKEFITFYSNLIDDRSQVEHLVREKKSYILYSHMGGELENLYQLFIQLVNKEAYAMMRTEDIKTVIAEFLIHCPVYRFYGNTLPFSDAESQSIKNVLDSIRITRPDLSAATGLLEHILLVHPREKIETENQQILHFYKRSMQFSGPLMAKGVEDTLMYTYFQFIAHNEVGDSPESFGLSVDEFHNLMKGRQGKSPLSLNATSTHDTKRGEDVRARLNVLTDLSEEWFGKVGEWHQMNLTGGTEKPDINDEYFIYQTLVGSFPFSLTEEQTYIRRLQDYLQKALREAKRYSNWTTPNEGYENKAKAFAASLLDKTKPFRKSFESFLVKIADPGIVNSLAQVILKFTCPGVPDLYQGTELWDLSLVDPDNRRPVNYSLREKALNDIEAQDDSSKLIRLLWDERSDGRIKLWLTHSLLKLRAAQKDLFTAGRYMPLTVDGAYKNNLLAFARIHQGTAVVIAVPLHIAVICKEQKKEITGINWKDTRIILPRDISGGWIDRVTDNAGNTDNYLPVREVFSLLPVCVVEMQVSNSSAEETTVIDTSDQESPDTIVRSKKNETELADGKIPLNINDRNSGVLMHITSLPSPFGIGDLGPAAKSFADFLFRTGQSWWQMLPVNPTEAGQGHSPYSAVSSRAGNILLVSPEILANQGLLDPGELKNHYLKPDDRVDYETAETIKKQLLEKAWLNFKTSKDDIRQQRFDAFCAMEAEWLDDFALYSVLKQMHGGKAWYEWPSDFKFRNEEVIKKLAGELTDELLEVKWLQFIFLQQWEELKEYCSNRNIFLIGDLPFYVSYDSADVWSHPHLFKIDQEGNRTGIAGVPPDAFSDDGQLWGMPVFRWDILKEQNYSWWIERLKKNWQLFDLIRLDHFRAFADYWEVPAGETTARNGEWKEGPGSDFFKKIKNELGALPFLAEDLGDINEKVIQLRDEFSLPGMKILQFAFGENYASSDYIPHNYQPNFFAYTGTHDNNTVVGWFRTEATEDTRARLEKYAGREVTEQDVSEILCRMAMSSVAKTAIIPMQDILELGERARMNIPASGENNWSWRLLPGQIDEQTESKLREWTELYNRLSTVKS